MTTKPLTFPAVVPAAGVGKRMGADRPKQYLTIGGTTLLEHTLNRLISHPRIDHIYLVLSVDDHFFDALGLGASPWLTRVAGGAERADSVLAALRHIHNESGSMPWVMVHDAARPCVSHTDIDTLLDQYDKGIGGILATPVRDTMKRSDRHGSLVEKTEPRDHLWHAMTPQFFDGAALLEAMDKNRGNSRITDEASAMELMGHPVALVKGCATNIKVTNPEDLTLASFYLSQE